jgi:large subunit ribosomal protein L33
MVLCYNITTSILGVLFLCPFMREALRLLYSLIYFRKTGGAVMRVKITLACTECKQRNYNTMKNKKNDPDRLEMNKYCRFCKKHTLHKETK